ncbi:MAG: hypothetical protein HC836_33000 [Richelia sp. RM2_1_2]|nr:hypothetical protein [Richelia sp. RM2_1_2]
MSLVKDKITNHFSNGEKEYEFEFLRDDSGNSPSKIILHGYTRGWYYDGSVSYIGFAEYGKMIGRYVEWHRKGMIENDRYFLKDKIDGEEILYQYDRNYTDIL